MIREKKLSLLKRELGKRLRLNEPLGKHTSFKIGGPGDLFYEVETEEEIIRVIEIVRELGIPYFILGGGSNLLVNDKGFRGMVIKIENRKWRIENEKVIAGAGAPLARLVEEAASHSLSGLEFAVGIPGTIGGAVVGNSGLTDRAIGDVVKTVKVLDKNGSLIVLNNSKCQFGYRSSIFQKKLATILEVVLKLKKRNEKEIREKMQQYLDKRKNQPRETSAGSIFKNPSGESAGELIEKVGLKAERIGQAQISSKHANWIINLGGASCQDVLKLIALAKKKVKEKFGIELEEEIEIVGES